MPRQTLHQNTYIICIICICFVQYCTKTATIYILIHVLIE